MSSPAALAERALLLEVAATPTPGNVDRERDLPDLRFEQFLAGATGARDGLERIAEGDAIADGFENAVACMAEASGTNTQFGSLLLLAPLLRASVRNDRLTPETASAAATATTVDDAAAFYRSFGHVDVRVDDPPADLEPLDVRRGSDAIPTLRDRGLTLADVMETAADRDGIAAEWTHGFERTFAAADRLATTDGPIGERAARVHLELLAAEPDTLVATKHDEATAAEVRRRAASIDPEDVDAVRDFSEELIDRGINPGTTADLLAGALFVALVRGEVEP
ncbi:triphosphoribosyl-dephospho-CoA protein [Salinarchaeum sp. Harcht-Bsk1]|uniref:triphosphoribosyl-dephospho-CoA synthase n=1 Tax=Salinarchaeum sp. Harcht-Bsk1 TaxID=1333523 RepID=UPI000342412F|nr:triphosphoribosyl-dephospho-CoA synthase [Salinarchaeum sp. Harcht-Bsk1]AGM99993.1 triphosphoribosyl-dephospho-CoA protein [Salinarchaeum sp. Harcht-Bsk1]